MSHSPTISRSVVFAGVVLLLTPTSDAEAQQCGTWSRPVLCEIEMRRSVQRAAWERFDPTREHRIAPNQELEIEVNGRDQFGRTFPASRLAIGFDDRECGSYLEVSDRGAGRLAIRARSSTGRCRLDLWIPGNLNFEWRVAFEVSAAARTGYSRAEAEIVVRALYAATLNREPDSASLGAATAEVQRGNLSAQMSAMLRSGEFQQSIGGVDAGALLDRFYRGILGRPADAAGVSTYIGDMQRRNYASVIMRLLQSGEFEERLTREQPGVATPATLYRMKKDPLRPVDRMDAQALRRKFGLEDD